MEILTETKANQSSTSLKQSQKQIIVKRPSLANLIGNSENTIFNCEDLEDGLSICERLITPSLNAIEGSDNLIWIPSAMNLK